MWAAIEVATKGEKKQRSPGWVHGDWLGFLISLASFCSGPTFPPTPPAHFLDVFCVNHGEIYAAKKNAARKCLQLVLVANKLKLIEGIFVSLVLSSFAWENDWPSAGVTQQREVLLGFCGKGISFHSPAESKGPWKSLDFCPSNLWSNHEATMPFLIDGCGDILIP